MIDILSNDYIKEKYFYNGTLCLLIVSLFLNSNFRPIIEVVYYLFFSYYFISHKKNLTRYFNWILLFLVFSGLSMLWSFDLTQSLLEFRILVQVALIGNLLIGYIDSKDKLLDVFKMIIIAGIILIGYLVSKLSIAELASTRLGGIDRVGINSNTIGLNLTFSSIFAFYFAQKNKNIIYYILYTIFSVFVVLSGSRKALLFVIAATVLIILLNSRDIKNLVKKLSIIVVITLLFTYLLLKVPILYESSGYRIEALILSMLGMGEGDGSTQLRSQMISDGLKLIEDRFLYGYGIRSYAKITGLGTYSHNNFIELLVGVGFIGTITYYSIYLYMFKELCKNKNKKYIKVLLSLLVLFPILEIGMVNYNDITWQLIIAIIYSATNVNKYQQVL